MSNYGIGAKRALAGRGLKIDRLGNLSEVDGEELKNAFGPDYEMLSQYLEQMNWGMSAPTRGRALHLVEKYSIPLDEFVELVSFIRDDLSFSKVARKEKAI